MSEYYGVAPSSDFFAHYGVRGMKWGVRKAIEKGDMDRLTSHYAQALLKKKRLQERTSRKGQKEEAKEMAKGGAALVGLGALGGLASYGALKGQAKLNGLLNGNGNPSGMYMVPTGLIGLSGLSAAGGLAALGGSGAAAYRATKRGNKKAVAKYNKFKNEMNKTFNKKTKNKIRSYIKSHPGLKLEDFY